jgi:transcriptional regulator with XRE-family HTH domain
LTRHRCCLADKLNHLIERVVPAGRGPYSSEEIAQATGLSVSYVRYLRSGARDNPTMQCVEALARFFGVPPAYFFDDDEAARIDLQLDQLTLLAALRRDNVRRVAARLGGLSDPDLAILSEFVERLHPGGSGSSDSPGSGPADDGRPVR